MKDKKLFITIISIFTIISFIIGVSYAYFVPIIIGNDTASSHHTKAGTLRLTYNGTNVLSLPNASTGDSASTTFTVTNSGTLPVNSYEIYFSKLVNTFINDEVVYTLTCTSSDTSSCSGKEQTPVPTNEEIVLTQGSIAPNTTHTYNLTVTFINKPDINQNYNQGKELKFTMTINEMEQEPTTLIARFDEEFNELPNQFWEYSENITEITFESTINIPANAIRSWDVSENQNNSIVAYIIDDGLEANSGHPGIVLAAMLISYHLYIQSNNEIYANPNSRSLFAGLYNVIAINNLNLLNTSNVTDMSEMFGSCSSLTSLDLSNFNTSNVNNMSYMFPDCSSLTSLDVSSFDTSSATNMEGMFGWCDSLTSLDLSSFDTSSVTNMSSMFYRCSSLTNLDLSNSIINNLISRCDIFKDCRSDLNIIVNDASSKAIYEYWLNNNEKCSYDGTIMENIKFNKEKTNV